MLKLLPLLVIFLSAVVPNLIRSIHGEFGMSGLNAVFTIIFGLAFVFYTYVFIKSFMKIKKLKEKLQ